MSKVYLNQTKLEMTATVGQDITGATETLIKYCKPSGTKGSFTATIEDAVLGILKFVDFETTTLDEAGDWIFWGFVTFSDGRKADGEPDTKTIYTPGS